MIKLYDVAFLKTTGEAVTVLAFNDTSPKIGDKPLLVTVRRPVAGQNGITHVVESFYLPELETLEEQRAKFIAERQQMVEKYGPKADTLPSVNPDNGFSSN